MMLRKPLTAIALVAFTLLTTQAPRRAEAQIDFGGVIGGIAEAAGGEILNRGFDQIGSELLNGVGPELLNGVGGEAIRMLTSPAVEPARYYTPYCDGRVDREVAPVRPTVGSFAEQQFAYAQQALQQKNYTMALRHADAAAKELPRSPDIQQLRSMILLAQGRYRESAGVAHRALLLGPGWNWKTLLALMGTKEHYVEHYDILKTAAKNNPENANLNFLLGYHYLMLGHLEAGRKQMLIVQRLLPNDALTNTILSVLPADKT